MDRQCEELKTVYAFVLVRLGTEPHGCIPFVITLLVIRRNLVNSRAQCLKSSSGVSSYF